MAARTLPEKLVEIRVFLGFGGVGFDLADAGDVVVQQGIQRGGRVALSLVAVAGVLRVNPSADHEDRNGRVAQSATCQSREIHHDADRDQLDERDETEFDAVDEHPLHGGDVFHDARHDVAGAAGIEPVEREALDLPVEVRADVEDDVLLEVVVHEDPGAIQAVLEQIAGEREQNPHQELPVLLRIGDDVIDHNLGDFREKNHRNSHQRGAKELRRRETGIPAQIGEDSENGLHWTARPLAANGIFVKPSPSEVPIATNHGNQNNLQILKNLAL